MFGWHARLDVEDSILNDTASYYDSIANQYHLFYRDWEAAMQREGSLLRRTFRDQKIVKVLDASCGTGTQSIALARLDYEVTAADPNHSMLLHAQENARKFKVADDITFVNAHFLNLPRVVVGPFDAVITKGNSLPHLLTDADLMLALRNFYHLLRPGGMVVIGIRDYDFMLEDRPRFVPRQFHEDEEQDVILFDVWDWDDGPPATVTFNTFIVSGKGEAYSVTKRAVVYRALRRQELEAMMKTVGFLDITFETQQWEVVAVGHKDTA
ncbi:MAG: class I SAM-dependent methyltransferase [Anaerolineae bacterium]|nr:class I SAM-dependent methyltransferase [Anaerolineae bacterium]